MRPLDQVRSSLDNWSPAELTALAAGIKRAQEYCEQIAPASVHADDLYQLARICSVGQQWNAADSAASAYIKSESQPYQAHAYAIRVNALLNLKDMTMAIEVARSMLHSVPYDATVDQSIEYLIHYLAMSLNDGALPLARERQPYLLTTIESGNALKEQPGDVSIGTATLYGEGLELAYLERYAGRQNEAQQTVAILDASLRKLPTEKIDNEAEIDRARTQYAFVGEMLPRISLLRYATSGNPRPHINPDYGSATVLLLFPAWCEQCRKMMQPLSDFLLRNNTENIHAYGLLALNEEETTADPFKGDSFKDLLHTPTLTTSSDTLRTFGAVSFPFLVITDGAGRIRFLGAVSQNAFDAGGFVEQVIDRNAGKGALDKTPSPRR
jgi:tetratricopeptide (TPR) repeat protein